MIDLFSDTKTRPTAQMRAAMMEAEVGDEQMGEDPSVNALCERVADMLGKESAVFLPSGCMGNELAIKVLCRPGDDVVCERSSHIVHYEAGAPAALSGVTLMTIDGDRGRYSVEQARAVMRIAQLGLGAVFGTAVQTVGGKSHKTAGFGGAPVGLSRTDAHKRKPHACAPRQVGQAGGAEVPHIGDQVL